jgi:hypothetical protein
LNVCENSMKKARSYNRNSTTKQHLLEQTKTCQRVSLR